MARQPILNLYLPYHKRAKFAEGQSIFGRVAKAVAGAGWQVVPRNEYEPVSGEGYHMVHNRPVTSARTLNLRVSYLEPFYRIEATNDRWDWDIAAQPFVAKAGGDWFLNHWQKHIFADRSIGSDGYIFMPLQGKLDERRHFQATSPLEMIASTLDAAPQSRILATLHPRESYSATVLDALANFGPRFALSDRPSLDLLARCDCVVTQNSSLAFHGFFARKPTVLFARIDFHHIAGSVPDIGVKRAFASLTDARPYGAYLQWFLRDTAISAWAPDAEGRILARLAELGWPMKKAP